MKKKITKKTNKPKLPIYKDGGDSFGKTMKDVGLFAGDTMLAEWAPNAIKQDQYSDTRFGKQLGNVASVHESFDSQSPISKNVSKMWNDGKTGMSEDQMKLYGQAQPIAKTGSKIGEMWTMKGMSAMGDAPGTAGQRAAGQVPTGAGQNQMGGALLQGANMGLNTQYNPMQNMQNPEDPKINGANSYGMKQQNPYYAQGGITQPNAEVEKQENILTPDGQFGQFNGPSHDQGGIPTNLPEGTKVFSDRLKMPKTGKTFADLNKSNNTKKEDKILEDNKSNTVAKATASLMKLAKQTNSDKLFQSQEALKQSKIDNYTMRLGGIVKYPDGGPIVGQGMIPDSNYARTNAQGFPVDSTGRPLTGSEQLGFNRPFNSYNNGAGTLTGVSNATGTNGITGKASLGIQNAGGIGVPKTSMSPTFVYDPSKGSYDDQWNSHLKKVNLAPFAIGGIKGEDDPNIIVPGTQPSNVNLGDPTDNTPYQGFRDKYSNTNNLTPDQAAQLNYTAQNPTPDKVPSSGVNWGNMAKQGILGLVNNAGNIYDLARSKDIEKVKYGKLNPRYLDPTASLRDVDMQSKIAEYNIRDKSTGNAGTYLSNRSGLAASTALTKDKIQREYQNANADISNSAQQFNIGQQIGEDTVNRQIRGNARNIKANAISNIGTNAALQYKDTKLEQGDKDRIELIKSMYPAIRNNAEIMDYYKKKGWLTDAEIKDLERQHITVK